MRLDIQIYRAVWLHMDYPVIIFALINNSLDLKGNALENIRAVVKGSTNQRYER